MSGAWLSVSNGLCCGLYVGGGLGMQGSYVGAGGGGSLRAFARGGGAWVGVGVGVGNCVGDTGLGLDVGDSVGVWMGCERFCVVDDVVI